MTTKLGSISIGLRVLVVDDDPVNRMYAVWLLAKLGCSPEEANNGLQAVAKVQQKQFHVVLMDCFMPELDGCDATRRIRGMEREGLLSGPPLWILGVTACPTEEPRRFCLEAGMNDFLAKPYLIGDLLRRLEQYHTAGAASQTPAASTDEGVSPRQVQPACQPGAPPNS